MKKGFSTIEIMIAMVIIITAISAILMTTFGNQNFLIGGQTNAEALDRAGGMLENAEAQGRKDFRLVNPKPSTSDGYYTTWTDVGPSSSTNDYFTKLVTSHVEWIDDSRIRRNVKLQTLISNFENVIGGDTCNSYISGNWASPASSTFSLGTLVGDTPGTYPITDIEAYKGKMYVTVNQPSGSSPVNSPSLAIDNSGLGAISWNSPENVKVNDSNNATVILSGTSVTHYIKATNFGFSIPNSATILGIKVEIEKSRSGGTLGQAKDSEVKIVKSDGNIGTTNKSDPSNWSTTPSYTSYGGNADLWGESWSPADINNSNFGVAISATGGTTTTNRVANIDHIRITITYIKEFYILDLGNPSSPTLYASLHTNAGIATGFNAVALDDHYAYIATNSGPAGGQLQIIDISTSTPAIVKTYAVPYVTGTGSQALGNSIFYHNGYIYIGLTKTASGPEFNIIDVHNPLSPAFVGAYAIGSSVNSIYVRNNTAYVTTSDNNKEVVVLDISYPSIPTIKLAYNAIPDQSGFGYGRTEYVVGDMWYLGRTYISSAPEFSVLNASSGTPLVVTTKDIGPNSSNPFSLNGIIIRDYLAFLLSGSGTKGGQLQIINASTGAQYAPPIAWPNNTSGSGGSAIDCEGNYIYAGAVDSSNNGYITVVTGS